jgi:hypothetical protein
VSRLNGFTGPVSLSVSGSPSRGKATFTPNPANAASTLKIKTAKGKGARGIFTLTVMGVSGALSHQFSVELKVTR